MCKQVMYTFSNLIRTKKKVGTYGHMSDNFDIKSFWTENEVCYEPFSTNKPRAPLTLIFEDHFVTNLVPPESTIRYYADPAYAIEIHKQANNILENELGKRFYSDDATYYVKGAFEVRMGSKRIIRESGTPWLETKVENVADLKKLIHSAENWDAKRQGIPDEWKQEKDKLWRNHRKKLLFAHMTNGPATIACNILGTNNTCMFMMDEPDLMDAFFAVMADKYMEFYDVAMLEDIGIVEKNGLSVNDDNCYIFPPKQYERFCAPFLQKLFDKYAPKPQHLRRQHSDSAMGHLMGILNDLGVNEVNFGPDIHPLTIRKAMPKAIIHGQVPPFVLRNGSKEELEEYVKRDFAAIGGDGGLVVSLAGVVPESTPMQQIRNLMCAVHEYTRYTSGA